jgi:P-type Mg2+ transporter
MAFFIYRTVRLIESDGYGLLLGHSLVPRHSSECSDPREGKRLEIPIAEMVPGNVALLSVGNLVPCDGRVIEAKHFLVNQALLTEEPFSVEKAPGELPRVPYVLTAGNTVLLGTLVISGTAKVLICRTGQNTELGEIADTLIAKAAVTAFELGTQHLK